MSVQTEANKDLTYIELNVGTSDSDEARTLVYNANTDNSLHPKLKIFWGNDGDKVKVLTVISKDVNGVGLKVLHKAPLEWEITRGGTRLVYKGKIPIPTAELTGVNELYLSALAGKEQSDNEFRKGDGFTALNGSGQANPVDLDVPMLMEIALQRSSANPNRFINHPSGGETNNKFVPYGDLLTVTIHNHLDIPITPTRAKYDFVSPGSEPMQLSVKTSFLDEADGQRNLFEYITAETVFNGPLMRGRVLIRNTPYQYDGFPAMSIAPGATQHYVIWYPSYTDLGREKTKLSFEFLEQAASQALVVVARPPAIFSNNTNILPELSVSGYILDIGQP